MEHSSETIDKDVVELLNEFQGIFKELEWLPLPCKHDHQIVLKEGIQPITNRPYRYPCYQKAEIEQIVVELLKSGVIRPSSNPFLSLVLLVHKTDGS